MKLFGKAEAPKKVYVLPKISKKKREEMKAAKQELGNQDTLKEKWFKARRREMVGVCQCGCGAKSCKNDEMYFRHSASHVFPKAQFESVMYHPLNFVERAFWGGCHTNMDEKGVEHWPNMADWEDIREKFFVLAPLLTDQERATKFYKKLEKLVYA